MRGMLQIFGVKLKTYSFLYFSAKKSSTKLPTIPICKTLLLTQRHHATFLENTKENKILFKVIKPFVVYGYPSLATIRELLFKKVSRDAVVDFWKFEIVWEIYPF